MYLFIWIKIKILLNEISSFKIESWWVDIPYCKSSIKIYFRQMFEKLDIKFFHQTLASNPKIFFIFVSWYILKQTYKAILKKTWPLCYLLYSHQSKFDLHSFNSVSLTIVLHPMNVWSVYNFYFFISLIFFLRSLFLNFISLLIINSVNWVLK